MKETVIDSFFRIRRETMSEVSEHLLKKGFDEASAEVDALITEDALFEKMRCICKRKCGVIAMKFGVDYTVKHTGEKRTKEEQEEFAEEFKGDRMINGHILEDDDYGRYDDYKNNDYDSIDSTDDTDGANADED